MKFAGQQYSIKLTEITLIRSRHIAEMEQIPHCTERISGFKEKRQ